MALDLKLTILFFLCWSLVSQPRRVWVAPTHPDRCSEPELYVWQTRLGESSDSSIPPLTKGLWRPQTQRLRAVHPWAVLWQALLLLPLLPSVPRSKQRPQRLVDLSGAHNWMMACWVGVQMPVEPPVHSTGSLSPVAPVMRESIADPRHIGLGLSWNKLGMNSLNWNLQIRNNEWVNSLISQEEASRILPSKCTERCLDYLIPTPPPDTHTHTLFKQRSDFHGGMRTSVRHVQGHDDCMPPCFSRNWGNHGEEDQPPTVQLEVNCIAGAQFTPQWQKESQKGSFHLQD